MNPNNYSAPLMTLNTATFSFIRTIKYRFDIYLNCPTQFMVLSSVVWGRDRQLSVLLRSTYEVSTER